jgi:hypothetical protein
MRKSCPRCGASNDDTALVCSSCGAPLAAAAADTPEPDAALVPVFETTQVGLLPLARLTLDQAGIEYAIRNLGMSDLIVGFRSTQSIGETDAPIEIVVRTDDAARAREVLAGIADAGGQPVVMQYQPTPTPAGQTARPRPPVNGEGVDLFDLASGAHIGTLTDAQFDTLAERLEAESVDDDDYYIDGPTLTMLQESGADPSAIELLRRALDGRDNMDIRWARR